MAMLNSHNLVGQYRQVLDQRISAGALVRTTGKAAHMMPPPEAPEPASQLCAALIMLDHLGVL